MVKTHALSHVALSALDPDRSLAFYNSVFGVREYFRHESTIQVLGPGQYDVLAFERRPAGAGAPGGSIHFGLRLTRPEDIDAAVAAVEGAGFRFFFVVNSARAFRTLLSGIRTAMKLKFGLNESPTLNNRCKRSHLAASV